VLVAARPALRRLRPALALLRRHRRPRTQLVAVGMTSVDVEAITTLTAQHVVGRTVEDDGELSFWVEDGGGTAVELTHEIGNPELAARRITELANALHLHAERIRGRNRVEVSWT
jgi:hypothetical protein